MRKMPPPRYYEERLNRIRAQLVKHDSYALLIFNASHIRYLVGFSGSDAVLLIGSENVSLLVDGRYTTQAGQEAHAEIFEYKEKFADLSGVIRQREFQEIGFDAEAISFEQYHALAAELKGIRVVPLGKELESIRCIKDGCEIQQIKKAAEIASTAYNSILASIQPGIEERRLALELEYKMRLGGAEAAAFEIIVASGPNSAMPHAVPGERKLRKGDLVVIDFGAKHMGYHSDETCTVGLGKISGDQAFAYSVVKAAHDKGIEKIRAGVPCKEIDRVVREHLENNGFGPYFRHGTGHGVGLEVHEAPRLARNSEMILKAGMVVTVEPGIYIPGQWGIRIEDLVLVKEEGFEILSRTNKDLQMVGSG